jgi:hypothetical protein
MDYISYKVSNEALSGIDYFEEVEDLYNASKIRICNNEKVKEIAQLESEGINIEELIKDLTLAYIITSHKRKSFENFGDIIPSSVYNEVVAPIIKRIDKKGTDMSGFLVALQSYLPHLAEYTKDIQKIRPINRPSTTVTKTIKYKENKKLFRIEEGQVKNLAATFTIPYKIFQVPKVKSTATTKLDNTEQKAPSLSTIKSKLQELYKSSRENVIEKIEGESSVFYTRNDNVKFTRVTDEISENEGEILRTINTKAGSIIDEMNGKISSFLADKKDTANIRELIQNDYMHIGIEATPVDSLIKGIKRRNELMKNLGYYPVTNNYRMFNFETLKTGELDWLFYNPNIGAFAIVDTKTTSSSTELANEKYTKQLNAYAKELEGLFGIPVNKLYTDIYNVTLTGTMDTLSIDILGDCLDMAKIVWKKGLQGTLILGDKLQKGGNDYPVKETGIDTIEVTNYKDTNYIIRGILGVRGGFND